MVIYNSVTVEPKKVTDSVKTIKIKLEATAKEDVENPIYGFMIKNASKEPILGTNSNILGQNYSSVKKGQKVSIEWEVPNVFNDGMHYVDPAITYKGLTEVADWWEEAASFRVLRENPTPYLVNPDIDFKLKASK